LVSVWRLSAQGAMQQDGLLTDATKGFSESRPSRSAVNQNLINRQIIFRAAY
jgi:hypothetical protein